MLRFRIDLRPEEFSTKFANEHRAATRENERDELPKRRCELSLWPHGNTREICCRGGLTVLGPWVDDARASCEASHDIPQLPAGRSKLPGDFFLVLIRKISVVRAASVAVLMPQRILLFGSIARPASHKSDVSRGL
jgi:hypothetical protein